MKLWNHNVFSVSLFGFAMGASQFWTSPVLPKLIGEISREGSLFQEPITVLEASKIASYFNLGSTFGPILAGVLNDRIGRKKTLLLCAILLAVSYAVSAFATIVETLYITRIIIGIAVGCLQVVVGVYFSEISENCNRSTKISFIGVVYNLGSLVCLGIGPFVSVRIISLICGFPMLISVISFTFFTPESPYYLMLKMKETKARKSLIKLGKNKELDKTILEIQTFVDNSKNDNYFTSLFTKNLKALSISFGLYVAQELAGFVILSSYMQSIFIAAGSTIPSNICSIIVGCIQLISISVSTKLVDVLGKKPLFLFSTCGCCISLLILGVYFYLRDNAYSTNKIYWLPLFCFILYMITYKLALAGLPRAVMGEVFPANVKSLGTTITIVFQQVLAFFITMYFPLISQVVSMAYSFWFFSICCAITFVSILYALPETKGKSFDEIQAILHGKQQETRSGSTI